MKQMPMINQQRNIFASPVIFISVLMLIIINHAVFNVPNLMWSMPWLSTIGVFFWAIFAKKEFQFAQVFMLGVLEDIIVGTVFGFHAFLLIVAYRIALQQQKYLVGKPFKVIWFGFTLTLIFVFVVAFGLTSILGSGISSVSPFNWLITCLSFPLVYVILLSIRNKWVPAS
jgi:rod shape-determining protein MreD